MFRTACTSGFHPSRQWIGSAYFVFSRHVKSRCILWYSTSCIEPLPDVKCNILAVVLLVCIGALLTASWHPEAHWLYGTPIWFVLSTRAFFSIYPLNAIQNHQSHMGYYACRTFLQNLLSGIPFFLISSLQIIFHNFSLHNLRSAIPFFLDLQPSNYLS